MDLAKRIANNLRIMDAIIEEVDKFENLIEQASNSRKTSMLQFVGLSDPEIDQSSFLNRSMRIKNRIRHQWIPELLQMRELHEVPAPSDANVVNKLYYIAIKPSDGILDQTLSITKSGTLPSSLRCSSEVQSCINVYKKYIEPVLVENLSLALMSPDRYLDRSIGDEDLVLAVQDE